MYYADELDSEIAKYKDLIVSKENSYTRIKELNPRKSQPKRILEMISFLVLAFRRISNSEY